MQPFSLAISPLISAKRPVSQELETSLEQLDRDLIDNAEGANVLKKHVDTVKQDIQIANTKVRHHFQRMLKFNALAHGSSLRRRRKRRQKTI